jgi:GR25 family glycosyltransferase involved in LPS biosynthesis
MNFIDKVAVCSKSFSQNIILRENLLKKYKHVTFNDSGLKMYKNELIKIIEPSALKSIFDNYRKEHYELSYGAVGCSLSHFNLWKKLEIDNLDSIIIFEDDAYPSFNFIELQEIDRIYFETKHMHLTDDKINDLKLRLKQLQYE